MLPRALLFSPDEQTSRLLMRALAELSIQIERCPEIFAAIEKLTTRNFQIIIADWVQEVEASFFLTAARELEFSQASFALAVVREMDRAAAIETGANGILEKPFTLEQATTVLTTAIEAVTSQSAGSLEQAAPASIPGVNDEQMIPQSARGIAVPSEKMPAHRTPVMRSQQAFSFAGYANNGLRSRHSRRLAARMGWLGLAALVLPIGIGAWKAASGASLPRVPSAVATFLERRQQVKDPVTKSTGSAEATQASEAKQQGIEPTNERFVSPRTVIRVRPVVAQSQNQPAKEVDGTQVSLETAKLSEDRAVPQSLLMPAQTTTARILATNPHLPGTPWLAGPLVLPEETSRSLLVHSVVPIYPEKALQARLQGTVVLQALVGRDGSIRDLKLVYGYLVLGQAAFEAVRQWRYRPYRWNGEIVEMQTLITVDFGGL
jgi:TonB family protein